jgi:anti-sigma factor RsiW
MREDTDRRWHESPEYRQEQLSAALDGMLTPEEQAALDAHLAGCESCRRELEELRQVRSLLRAVPEPALPRSFLLPMDGDLPAPHSSHTPPAAPASRPPASRSPAPVTPLRSAPRQPERREPTGVRTARASRTLQVTRWIGTIAAILGLALFIGTLLPQAGRQNSAASTSAPYGANAPTGAGANGATSTKPPQATGDVNGHGPSSPQIAVTATSTVQAPTATSATLEATPHNQSAPSGPSLADILRIAALVLLFAGAAVAIASLVMARRV